MLSVSGPVFGAMRLSTGFGEYSNVVGQGRKQVRGHRRLTSEEVFAHRRQQLNVQRRSRDVVGKDRVNAAAWADRRSAHPGVRRTCSAARRQKIIDECRGKIRSEPVCLRASRCGGTSFASTNCIGFRNLELPRPSRSRLSTSAWKRRIAAFDWLQRRSRLEAWELPMLKADPMFDPLRSDPRFLSLLDRLGLPPLMVRRTCDLPCPG